VWPRLKAIENLHILADNQKDRLSIISFYIEDLHYNLAVKLLNDRYGIQVRGGCSCAGTYGHYLLEVSYEKSRSITDKINFGDNSNKPGWVRLSLHPTMTNAEAELVCDAIEELCENHKEWALDYIYSNSTNEYRHIHSPNIEGQLVDQWFSRPMV